MRKTQVAIHNQPAANLGIARLPAPDKEQVVHVQHVQQILYQECCSLTQWGGHFKNCMAGETSEKNKLKLLSDHLLLSMGLCEES
jgi:hypothetical protein